MSLDIWSQDDIRNVILSANMTNGDLPVRAVGNGEEPRDPAAYRAGYEAALVTVATAFGIPLGGNGGLRAPGVVIPAGRLALSYRAEKALYRLLASREEGS